MTSTNPASDLINEAAGHSVDLDEIDWAAVGPAPIEVPTLSPEGIEELAIVLAGEGEPTYNEGEKLAYRWIICEVTRGDFDRIAAEFTAQECRELIARYQINESIMDGWMDSIGVEHGHNNSIYISKVIPALRWRIEKLERPQRVYTGESRIERIKRAVTVEEVAERYTRLRPAGSGKLRGSCPVHSEKTPSFVVYTKQQTWHCYGQCSRGGDVLDPVQQLQEAGRW
jgi:hypothetical protein